jgi:hypothetical protein
MSSKPSKSTTFWVGVLIFIIFTLAEGFIQILEGDLYNLVKGWLASFSVSPYPILSLTFLVLIIIGILLIAISFLRKSPSEKKRGPNFDHVEARFFFPLKTKRSERDLNHSPHKKIVMVKDSRKAYFVGEYAMNLIKKKKIEWFSEDEQDLGEWCERNGYTLIPEDGTEDKLLEPFFEAEIKEKKTEYHRGDFVLFRTRFRGELTYGFFDNRITHSENKKFHHGQYLNRKKNRAYSWATDTLSADSWWIPAKYLKGMLNGYVNKTSEWSYGIPFDAPLGEYRIAMRVFNRTKPPTIILRQKEDTITVVV